MFEPKQITTTPKHYAHYKVQVKGVNHYDTRQTTVWIRISVLDKDYKELHVLFACPKMYTDSPLTESIIRQLRDSIALWKYKKINPPTESIIFEIGNLAPFLIATNQINQYNGYFKHPLMAIKKCAKDNNISKITFRLFDKPDFSLDWIIQQNPTHKHRPSLSDLGIECRTWSTRQIEAIKRLYGN